MHKYLSKFNVVAIVGGILISLLLTIILKLIIGDAALWLLPVLTGFIAVFLANETDFVSVGISGLIAGLITFIWVGPLFIILAPAGGCLGALLNSYLGGSNVRTSLSKVSASNESRVRPLENWVSHPMTNKLIPIVVAVVLGIVLIWGVGLPVTDTDTLTPAQNTTNNITVDPEQTLQNNVKAGVESFFKNFNTIFNQDGTNNGYIISTITINNMTKVSDTEVNVTVTLVRKTNTGETLNSMWSGPFYLVNGTWIDKGDFVQVQSTKSTGG